MSMTCSTNQFALPFVDVVSNCNQRISSFAEVEKPAQKDAAYLAALNDADDFQAGLAVAGISLHGY